MEPVVGQLRRMTVPHIHGNTPVVVKVRIVKNGKVALASCVECPSVWHEDSSTRTQSS